MKTSALRILVAAMMLTWLGCDNRGKTDISTEESKDIAHNESQETNQQASLSEPLKTEETTEEEIFQKASTGDEHSTSFLLDKIRLEKDSKRQAELAKYLFASAETGNSEALIEIRSLIQTGKVKWDRGEESFSKYKQESEKGNLNAMVLMSQLLRTGNGTDVNHEQATKLVEQAALEGHLVAQYLFGEAMQEGEGIPKDNREGAKWILKAAESGLGQAEANASSIYRIGRGLERNPEKAYLFAKKSHEKNEIAGILSLSILYMIGCGVEKDINKAIELAEEALKRGSAKAYTQIAYSYANLAKWESALKYAKLGVEAGDVYASGILGALYSWGLGTKQDPREGEKHLRSASTKGCALANFVIGQIYFDKGEKKLAYDWLSKAAEDRHPDSIAMLGFYYHSGISPVKKDSKKAFLLYQEAAELGSRTGKLNLAEFYMAGLGTQKDYRKGVELFQELAKNGEPGGFVGLGRCYLKGEGVVKNEAEALVQYYLANAYGGDNSKEMIAYLEGRLSPSSVILCQQKAEQIYLKKQYEDQNPNNTDKNKPAVDSDAGKLPVPVGSGVIISQNGMVVTAYHVIENAKRIAVKTEQGVFNVKVLAADKLNDLALMKISGANQTFAAAGLAPSGKVKMGQSVFTLGFPNSSLQGFNVKMTKGEISSITGIQDDPRQFQISVPVQPGNSGGALFDERGNVIGVVVAKLNEKIAEKYTGNSPQNVNYAVKSSYVFPLIEQSDSHSAPPNEDTTLKFEEVVDKVKESCVMVLIEE